MRIDFLRKELEKKLLRQCLVCRHIVLEALTTFRNHSSIGVTEFSKRLHAREEHLAIRISGIQLHTLHDLFERHIRFYWLMNAPHLIYIELIEKSESLSLIISTNITNSERKLGVLFFVAATFWVSFLTVPSRRKRRTSAIGCPLLAVTSQKFSMNV